MPETAFCCKNIIKKIFFSEFSDDTGYRFKVAGTGWPQIIIIFIIIILRLKATFGRFANSVIGKGIKWPLSLLLY